MRKLEISEQLRWYQRLSFTQAESEYTLRLTSFLL